MKHNTEGNSAERRLGDERFVRGTRGLGGVGARSPVAWSKVYPPSLSVMPQRWQVKQLRWKNRPSALTRSSA